MKKSNHVNELFTRETSQVEEQKKRALFQFPLSKFRVLCLFYVLLRLNAWCYAVKYEEKISSKLSICSPRQIPPPPLFQVLNLKGVTGKEPWFFSSSPLSNSILKSLFNIVIMQWKLAWWKNRQFWTLYSVTSRI